MVYVQFHLFDNLLRWRGRVEFLPLFEVRFVELEDFKTTILFDCLVQVELPFLFFIELFDYPVDAFLADVSYSFIARLEGFAVFRARFGELDEDKLAVDAVLRVQVKHSVGGGGGTGEKIEN